MVYVFKKIVKNYQNRFRSACVVRRLPSVVRRPSSAVRRPPSAVRRPPRLTANG